MFGAVNLGLKKSMPGLHHLLKRSAHRIDVVSLTLLLQVRLGRHGFGADLEASLLHSQIQIGCARKITCASHDYLHVRGSGW